MSRMDPYTEHKFCHACQPPYDVTHMPPPYDVTHMPDIRLSHVTNFD